MKKKSLSRRTIILFKRFRRTPYAVFNSLKQVVNIAVLPVACLTFAHAGKAQELAGKVHLQEVEVQAEINRASTFAQIVEDLGDLTAIPAQNLQDALDALSGLDVRQRGTNGVQADISIRGSSADQVVMLLNGINVTDAQTGHYNLNLPFDLSAIDGVEILYSGSRLRALGVAPFGGAVNIVTKERRRNDVSVGVAAGEHGYVYQNADVSFADTARHLAASLSLSRQRSDGYVENTDFDATNVYFQSVFDKQKAGELHFQAGFQDKGAGANDFYYFGGYQYDWQRTFFSALSWDKRLTEKVNLHAQASWRELHNRFESYRDFREAPDIYLNHNYHKTDVFGGQARLQRRTATERTTLGIDLRDECVLSNKLGNPLHESRPVPFAPDSIRFLYGKNRLQANLFFDEMVYLHKFTLAGGAALNQSNDYGTNFSGGADIGYQVRNVKLYAGVNRAFRFPTFTDLYYTTNESHTSDPNLKPEKATTVELGAKYHHNSIYAEADIFYRAGTDIIDWIRPYNTAAKWQSAHTDINALGGDVAVVYLFRNTFLKKARASYAYLTQDKKQMEGYDSKYALDYLKHKCTFSLYHTVYKALSLNWNATLEDRNGDYTLNNKREAYKPFFLLNARLQWQTGKVNVFADFNNIFNKQYADFGGIMQPGLWIKTGICVKLTEW